MKKMMGFILTVLLFSAMLASVAVADDRLQLNGETRIRYWNKDYGSNQTQDYFDQRFRIGANLNVADGVKIITRMDVAEGTWGGANDWTGTQWRGEDAELQIDRAYIQVDRKRFTLAAGQQNITLGNVIAYDNQGTGIKLDIKTPVVITLGYTKESEGNRNYDTNNEDKDIDTCLINLGYKADGVSVNAFYASAFDDIKGDDSFEPRVFGLQSIFTTGILSFNGEVNVFDGDAFGYDVTGVQAWMNMEARVLDNLKLGVDLVWSKGNDDDSKIKLTAINDWNNITYMDRGPLNTMVMPGGISDMFDPVSPMLGASAFRDAAFSGRDSRLVSKSEVGSQSGAIGGGIYGIFTPIESVNIYAQAMYMEPEDDDLFNMWDNLLLYSIAASWTFAPNTTISAQYHRTDWDSDYNALDDSAEVIAAMLIVVF